ncbi:MAG TPA: hotdog fold domain-containing protein [Polyangia bacterium]|nr:hotdog fold domain-containing protein [Polyangia bacterium]
MCSVKSLLDPNGSSKNLVRAAWDRLQKLPGGKRVFSQLAGLAAPYTGTIGGRVKVLRRGHATVELRDRRAVRNHLSSVHAIALANLAELTGNIAVAYTLPDDARFIVAGISVDYVKKARGTISGTCDCPLIESNERKEYAIHVSLRDHAGDEVAHATLRTLVGPKKQA